MTLDGAMTPHQRATDLMTRRTFGATPRSADAGGHGFVANILFCPIETPLKVHLATRAGLTAHCHAPHALIGGWGRPWMGSACSTPSTPLARNAACRPDPVREEALITRILDAAIRAPSDGNTQRG